MGVNLSILYYDLEKYHPQKGNLGSVTLSPLEYFSFYCPGGELKRECLYILETEHEQEACLEPAVSFICLGHPDLTRIPENCNIIWIPGETNISNFMSDLSRLFWKYQRWENQMYQAMSRHRPISMLGKLSLDIFREPLSLFANNFLTIFSVYQEKYGKIPKDFSLYKEKEYLPMEVMASIEKSDDLKEALKKKLPYIYRDEGEKRTLCCNIWINGKHVGTLQMDELNHRICERDAALLYILSQHIAEAFKQGYALRELEQTEVQTYIQDLLEGKTVSYGQAKRMLESTRWKLEDRYVCILLKATGRIPEQALFLHGGALAKCLGNAVFVIWKEKIVLVCSLSNEEGGKYRDALKQLESQLADIGFTGGVSSQFRGLEKLPYFVQTAQAAVEYGQKDNPDICLYGYDRYMHVLYTAKALENTIPDVYIPSELLQVVDYDRERQTDYVKVLRGLLQNNMSATETAKALYMHRNTVIHRTERLKEYFGMDLDSYEYRLKLIQAFEVLDYINAGKS